MLTPVYTQPENCQDCYKCIRECPVKAIKVEGNKASIIDGRCIYCGHCTQVCPTGAKKVRDGLTRAKYILDKYQGHVYLSLAPSYVSEFSDIPASSLIAAIKRLGFNGVSETALGAEIVSAATEKLISAAEDNVYISSACPVVVDYIRKYAPSYTRNITPIVSPMLAHALMLKEEYGKDIKIVFAGPCIGKKSESDRFSDLIDVVITFKDLREWFENEAIDPALESAADEENVFIPHSSGLGALYPIDGGMIAGLGKLPNRINRMSFSGLDSIKDVIEGLDPDKLQQPVFLELLACRGGCVNGPAKLAKTSIACKRDGIVNKCVPDNRGRDYSGLDVSTNFTPDPKYVANGYSEQEIKDALASVGKVVPADELNCSCCGYDSCRDFAVAMLNGHAENNMCASYMRKVAHDKATVLLQKIPAGVILVNSSLKVVDMNRTFAAYMGDDTLSIYDLMPGMGGAELGKICEPIDSFFRTALATGEELHERRTTIEGKRWLLSIYNIQKNRQVFGLLQNLQEPAVRQEWILEKTREVIRNHMTTVQNVAGLLGENAAYTDSSLRSIIAAFDDDKDMDSIRGKTKANG